jgi:hypothetical protein
MWAIRILNGTRAGEIISLKEGKTRIGRGQTADVQINAGGVSKEHLEINMNGESLDFTDLNSSNGTFLNGTRVKGGKLKLGDKVGIHNIMFDIVVSTEKLQQVAEEKAAARKAQIPRNPIPAMPNFPVPANQGYPPAQNPAFNLPTYPQQNSQFPQAPGFSQPQVFAQPQNFGQPQGGMPQPPLVVKPTFSETLNKYIDEVLLVGFYQLTEAVELKIVLMGFIALYVGMVTMLAIIPMKRITSESVVNESRLRAMTVARALARGNEKILKTGEVANFSVEFALHEDGIEDVYVIGKDGRIVAPPDRMGSAPKEMSFYRDKILKAGTNEVSGEIGDKIGASVPILGYDSELQRNVAKAYAVVIYNPGNLMFDDGKVFGLFIQVLFLALAAGFLLFLLMFKMVEHPFHELNKQLDMAMREEKSQVEVKVQLPILHDIVTNLNSLISRANNPSSENAGNISKGAKNHEYINLVGLLGYPALLVSTEGLVIKTSRFFEELTGVRPDQIEQRKISELEQGLQKNIETLMAQSHAASAQIAQDNFEFSSGPWLLNCQALTLPTGEVDCYLIVMTPIEGVSNVA